VEEGRLEGVDQGGHGSGVATSQGNTTDDWCVVWRSGTIKMKGTQLAVPCSNA
jgi:hypothetical protein